MGFSFFGKKENKIAGPVFTDKTYISTAAKMNACLDLAKKEPACLFICWFPETARKFKEFFREHKLDEILITEARSVHTALVQNKMPVFTEHHPLHNKEMELVRNWAHKELIVFNALDEPLLRYFGSDRVIKLVEMLGMKEEDAIEHALVSRSIITAQEKIASKLLIEQAAGSPEEWMQKNMNKQ